jgi:hypothetical protein
MGGYTEHARPVLGQEAVCPDGLGRVVAFDDGAVYGFIQVDTYVNNRSCKWAPHNVRLVKIEYQTANE